MTGWDKYVKKAIRKSITNIEKMKKEGKTFDNFWNLIYNSPLCRMFKDTYRCEGCPIFILTSRKFCHGSPLMEFNIEFSLGKRPDVNLLNEHIGILEACLNYHEHIAALISDGSIISEIDLYLYLTGK